MLMPLSIDHILVRLPDLVIDSCSKTSEIGQHFVVVVRFYLNFKIGSSRYDCCNNKTDVLFYELSINTDVLFINYSRYNDFLVQS